MELKLPEKVVRTKIFFIRHIVAHLSGQKAMPDEGLVLLYQVETKRLNEQVKHNQDRFPADFTFQWTYEEFENLKSQFTTSSWGGRRKLPFAFTVLRIILL